MFRHGIDGKKLLPAIVVCFTLFFAGLVLLAYGCAYRHLPGGGKAPATAFEQVLAWNAAGAQANSGLADTIIGLQRAGFISIPAAKSILIKQGQIAEADLRITNLISAAAACAQQSAGANATTAELDAAGAACAKISAPQLRRDIDLVTSLIVALTDESALGIKDPAKRDATTAVVKNMGNLIGQVFTMLSKVGVLAPASAAPGRGIFRMKEVCS